MIAVNLVRPRPSQTCGMILVIKDQSSNEVMGKFAFIGLKPKVGEVIKDGPTDQSYKVIGFCSDTGNYTAYPLPE